MGMDMDMRARSEIRGGDEELRWKERYIVVLYAMYDLSNAINAYSRNHPYTTSYM